jgi:arylsulfatase A-like enzyme
MKIRITNLFLLFNLLLGVQVEAKPLAGSRPNIILVMTDDQGMGDLSCMGNQVVKTPNIDRFHGKATRFTDFQVSPTCAPTRAAIMSGRPPFKVGVTHTILQRERMAPDVFTLPQMLQSAGYATGLFGKWHLGDEEAYLPQNRGFDEVLMHGSGGIGQVSLGDFPPNKENVYFDNVLLHNDTIVQTKGFCTDLFFDAATAWIRAQHQSEQPYFAYISLNAPHAPLAAPESYKKRFLDLGYDKGTAGRYGMIENIDDNVGRLMERLAKWKALKNTLVIFMTDNGATHLSGKLNGERLRHFNANLRGGKNSPNEGGTHVPAFWQWPGVLAEGVDVDVLTAHLDLYPTFAKLAGAKLPEKMQPLDGRSLLPLLADPKTEWPERKLFVHCGRWPNGKQADFKFTKCAVRTDQWRFVNNRELYNIAIDPSETKDVAAEYPEVIEELRQTYDDWWDSALPMMVNEGLPRVRPDEQPLALQYAEQLKTSGIPDWAPAIDSKSAALAKPPEGRTERPNIVVFVADDMGWGDSGTYGHPQIQTPNLDKLASRGVKLMQCYSACAVCSPSRSAILTGRHPYRNGVWRHLSGQHDAHLRASEITYPKLLKSIGYETCHVGKWHLNSLPQFNTTKYPQPGDHGYGHWMASHNNAHPSHKNPDNFVLNGKPIGEQKGYSAQVVAAEATRWLTEIRDKSKPFALSVWVHEPHSPIATDPKFEGLYGHHDNRTYMGNISQLDHAVGQVMDTLDQEDVSQNTLFIFTSDNGPVARYGGTTGGLRGGKRSDHEGGIRVPGIVAWPGHIQPASTSSIPVIGTDIFTTVLNITGVPLPSDRTIDGVNMLPALAGKPVERLVPLFWRTHVSRPDDRVALRIGDWKIVGNDTLTKFQLYEIEKDWQEKNDLAAAMPDKAAQMKQRLLEVWQAIEKEGPDHWWKAERNKPMRGATINY